MLSNRYGEASITEISPFDVPTITFLPFGVHYCLNQTAIQYDKAIRDSFVFILIEIEMFITNSQRREASCDI
jgi:hypothetical protein